MHLSKNFSHDRLVLLFIGVNSFLLLIGTVLIILRLDAARSGGYIAEYRANLGISAFRTGSVLDILAFIAFMLMVMGVNTTLSMKVYSEHRNNALTILALGTLLLMLAIIVSNALLVLR